jgi:hypothetical protein
MRNSRWRSQRTERPQDQQRHSGSAGGDEYQKSALQRSRKTSGPAKGTEEQQIELRTRRVLVLRNDKGAFRNIRG